MSVRLSDAKQHSPTTNLLLGALPAEDYQRLLPHLEPFRCRSARSSMNPVA